MNRLEGPRAARNFAAAFVLLRFTAACSSDGSSDRCAPGDQDGVIGGTGVVLLTVSDSQFAVGGVDSGSTQRNITIQNLTEVTLTLTNVGTRPHSFVVACIPTGLPEGCPQSSCFPKEADIPPVDPGKSATATFVVPRVEGAYPFFSDAAGDGALIGQFVVD